MFDWFGLASIAIQSVAIKCLCMCFEWKGKTFIGQEHTHYRDKRRCFIVASEEFGLEENAEKSQYMVMSHEQAAGKPNHIQTVKYFENAVKC
jgi:hypothetical protein